MLKLKVLQNTFFKVSTASSSSLSDRQKEKVSAGQTFTISSNYKIENGHLKVELDSPISPVGASGYFYEKHIRLSKNGQIIRFDMSDLPAPPPGFGQLLIVHPTIIKNSPENSASLAPHQKAELLLGETFLVLGYVSVEDHFRVTLAREVPNFGKSGYIYRYHVQIRKDGKLVKYDPQAYKLTIIRSTTFKKRPASSSQLSSSEKITLSPSMVYGLASYKIESGHLKVSLTENLPQFGNTGYLYPPHVQVSRGTAAVSISGRLAYTGPKEVVAGKPTTLTGTYDAQRTAMVELVAEDKYPLTVRLNRLSGTWQVELSKGFSAAGARWLRLKATDSRGKLLGSEVVNIAVTTDSTSVGEELSLTIERDTFFKVTPVDSSTLNNSQKVMVKDGRTFPVSQYGLVDGHLKVTLATAIAPVGDFGYFYQPHVQLRKGNQVISFEPQEAPEVETRAEMLVTQKTFIKIQPQDSSNLPANQKAELRSGQAFGINGYASISGHFRVTLAESIPGFGNVGYIYWQHALISQNGNVVPYDPDAITATMQQSTVFKKRPVSSSSLSSSEKVTLPTGRVYGVSSYAIDDGHIKTALTEEIANFGNTGYLYPNHILMRRGSKAFNPLPEEIELGVPYFSQRDNPRFYWATCNVTSIAMVFYYYGVRSDWGVQLEDDLLQWILNKYGTGSQTDHSVLSALIRTYGFKHSFSTTRRWSEVKSELINRRPVVIAGDFTPTGHIVTLIGYDRQGYIANDPWGDALTGYANTEGRRLIYPYSYMDEVCGPDGNVWAHFIAK